MENSRGFQSRIGFILVSAGCAIGIGNVWKFPYMVGSNGGAVFVILYLVFLAILGIPVMIMELAIGRATKKSTTAAYKQLERKGSFWHIHGWFALVGNYILMMYYTTVAGWMLFYTWKFIVGEFDSPINTSDKSFSSSVFENMVSDPFTQILFMSIIVVLGFVVISLGVKNGLENINKVIMLALLGLIVILAINSLTLHGSGDGVKFYLMPNLNRVSEIGLGNVIVSAMNQAFFTLGVGIGSIEIFGSYMDKSHSLANEAVTITILDTFVAIVAGLIIFPACFSYGVSPDAGPSLIFVTLPELFTHMNGGRIWGTLFFLFMTFASFSTVTAVFENITTNLVDSKGISRKQSIIINLIIILIGSIPCALGSNFLSEVHLIGSKGILDSEDFILSNILLPIGALWFTVFCTTKWGWGYDCFIGEVNEGKGLKMPGWARYYLMIGLPILIFVVFITGLINGLH